MPRTTVFVSYARSDGFWLERLQKHLAPFERQGRIKRWDDTTIRPGTEWREEIRDAIHSARVAVLLLSADFLASQFIAENELPPLLAAARHDGATILSILVKPCSYGEIDGLERLEMVNNPEQPLVDLTEGAQERVFVALANAVRELLEADPPAGVSSEPATTEHRTPVRPAGEKGRRPTPWPGATRHVVPEGLEVWGNVDEKTLGRIRTLEFMNSTGHSILQKCDLDGTLCVLKATQQPLCDLEALAVLAKGGPRPSPSGAPWRLDAMATPRAVWLHDDYVWELQSFYEGRSLAAIVEEQRKPLDGPELSMVVNGVVDVLEALAGKGLVHRDISPGNVLMLDNREEIRIVDWSFCCLASNRPEPVGTPEYMAPEQMLGEAVCASDWYSLAATCFAIANGFTIHERGPAEFARGIKNIHLVNGQFRGWPEEPFFRSLLSENPRNRQAPWRAKNELYSINRSSGKVAVSARGAPSRSPFSWLANLLRSVRQR